MSKIIRILKKWRNLIKLVLFMSIGSLVIIEIVRMFKSISIDEVTSTIGNLAPEKVLSLFILGFVAVSPMMLYDYILNNELDQKPRLSYLLQTSWTINTLNNMIGFAGLVDVGLRYSFYADEERPDRSIQAISRVMPYFMSGFSFMSLISLILIFVFPSSSDIHRYWPALLAAALYLPIIILISNRKNLAYFGQMKGKTAMALFISSAIDWCCVSIFFILVGRFLGYHIPNHELLPLFMISITVGIMSMIPGSLGSFDIVIVTGLVSLGLDKVQALSWIFIYRLFYYICPFVVGVILFIKNMGGQINEKYLGIPKKVLESLTIMVLVWSFRLFAIFLIVSAIIPQELAHVPIVKELEPVEGQFIWQFPCILLGILYFLVSRLIACRIKFVPAVATVLGILTLIYLNIGVHSIPSSLFLTVMIAITWWNRREFDRIGYTYAWEDRVKDLSGIGATLIATLVFLARMDSHHLGSLYHMKKFVSHWLGLLIMALIIVLVYRVILRFMRNSGTDFGSEFNKERYENFLATIDNKNLDASLAFLGDKYLYWYQEDGEDRAVFQFAMENNKCVVMSDPLSQRGYLDKAISKFLGDAELENISVVFYEVNQETTLVLHDYGYDFMKFGEMAHVPLDTFTLEGKSGRRFRTAVNKLDNKGYKFEVLQPPFDDTLMATLRHISDSWLDGRQEKGFSLGYFDEEYIKLAPIAIARDENDEILAFVTFMVENSKEISGIDLMRYDLDKSPNGIMDYLFIKTICYFKEQGSHNFDLGMAPLSNVGRAKHSFMQEKIAYLIYAFTNRFYSFNGLRQYKEKFGSVWEPRYVAYPKANWLIVDMICIYRVDNRKIKKIY